MEMSNEFAIILLTYELMTFTEFVLNPEAQFTMGYVFVLTIGWILFVNIMNTIRMQVKRYRKAY